MANCKTEVYLLILDVVFTRGKCTIDDVRQEIPDRTKKTVQIYLRELEKLNLLIVDSWNLDESSNGAKPRNLYYLRCNCPLPGETDSCKSCPSGKVIMEMQDSVV